MFILYSKLRILKGKLKDWKKLIFGDIKIKMTEAENAIKAIQRKINSSGYTDCLQLDEAKVQHELEKNLTIEEKFWKEKANIKWHSEGDRNTKFFHTMLKLEGKIALSLS